MKRILMIAMILVVLSCTENEKLVTETTENEEI